MPPAVFFESGFPLHKVTIKVIGVGSGGGNAIDVLTKSGIAGIELMAFNSNVLDLQRISVPFRLQLGPGLTRGYGAGGDPERGYAAALEEEPTIRAVLRGTDLLVLTACMGGGTGTGATLAIAQMAREICGDKVLIFAVVTRPFTAEGMSKGANAAKAINELRRYVDSMLIVSNEKIFRLTDSRTSLKSAFGMVNNVMARAIRGIVDIINVQGDINLDFNDIRRVLVGCGNAVIGIGESTGQRKHTEAAMAAVTCPLLEHDVKDARALLVHFESGHRKLGMEGVNEAIETIKRTVGSDALLKFGTTYNDDLGDLLRITVVAAGFPAGRIATVAGTSSPRFAPDNKLIPTYLRWRHETEY